MEKRPPSDEIPALDQLASKVPAKPAPAKPGPAKPAPAKPVAAPADTPSPKPDASPVTPVPEPPRAPTTLGALEVKIELGPSGPRPGAEVSEDARTGDYTPAFTTEEVKATGLYAPAVSTLIDRLEEPEVAVAVDPNLAKLRLQLPHLKAIQDDLKAHLDPEDGLRAGILERAEAAVGEAYALLESLPRAETPAQKLEHGGEPEVSELDAAREALLEGTLELQRVIASCPAPPEPLPPQPAPAPHPEPKAPAAQKVRLSKEVAEEERQGRRRLIALAVLVGLLAVGRVVIFLQEGRQAVSALEEKSEAGRAQTTNHAAGATGEQLAAGIPSVLEVRLSQLEDGSLRARAAVIDPDGDPVALTYKWLENDREVEVEGRGVLVAFRVRPGSKYRVEVRASDGKRESDPLLSPVLVAGAGGSKP